LGSEQFLTKVKKGVMEDLDLDTIEIFEKVLPKPGEMQKLKEAVFAEGFSNLEEALSVIKFGDAEQFAIKVS
jgi:hypothetical protein